MRRLLPYPALSIALFLLWVLLVQSLSRGNLLLGGCLALFWPALARRLGDGVPRPRKPLVMARLLMRVVGDMLRSSAELLWALVTRRSGDLRPGFVPIPLDLKDPAALSALAMIVTFTPGTAWVELSLDKRVLLLHVFSVEDHDLVVSAIKNRYERPLREIFE